MRVLLFIRVLKKGTIRQAYEIHSGQPENRSQLTLHAQSSHPTIYKHTEDIDIPKLAGRSA
jgi:hypothetical protein